MKSNYPLKLRVSTTQLRAPVGEFYQFGANVVVQMTANDNYLLPYPTLPTVSAALDDLLARMQAASGGDKVAIAARDNSQEAAVMLMRQLANYVQAHCQNDRNILISSGFDDTKPASPIGPVAPPVAPIVYYDKRKVARARVSKPAGAYAVNWRLAVAATPTVYLRAYSTPGGRTTFAGLTPGETYNVEANFVGTMSESGWSPATQIIALMSTATQD